MVRIGDTVQGITVSTIELMYGTDEESGDSYREVACEAFETDPAGNGRIKVPANVCVPAVIREDAELGAYDVTVYLPSGQCEAFGEGMVIVAREAIIGDSCECGSVHLEVVA